jgi:cytoskeletal protein RodZ
MYPRLFPSAKADPRKCSMKSTRHIHSPETRRRAATSLRFLTRLTAVAATGATVVIGVVVAKEHPGGIASGSAPLQTPSTSTTVAPTTTTSPPTTTPTSSSLGADSSSSTTTTTTLPPTTTTIAPPTTTTTRPVATSGATRR